jgi:GT2 family glycosyltransferase
VRPASPQVAIVIVNWNGFDDTAACLQSLQEIDYENYSVTVVDNGSSDNSQARLQKRFPGHSIVQAGSNLGFAAGSNLGMRPALAHSADYLLLLNNDTRVHPQFLSRLVAIGESDDRIGITGARIEEMARPGRIWALGGMFNVNTGAATHFQSEEQFARASASLQPPWYLYVPGCVMLIKKKCLQDTGFLTERFFHLAEDVEFCVRAQRRSWTLGVAGEAIVFHKGSASMTKFSPVYNYYEQRNRLYLIRQYRLPRLSVRSAVWDGIMISARLFLVLITVDEFRHFFRGARFLGLAVYDFLRDREGRCENDISHHSLPSVSRRGPRGG